MLTLVPLSHHLQGNQKSATTPYSPYREILSTQTFTRLFYTLVNYFNFHSHTQIRTSFLIRKFELSQKIRQKQEVCKGHIINDLFNIHFLVIVCSSTLLIVKSKPNLSLHITLLASQHYNYNYNMIILNLSKVFQPIQGILFSVVYKRI